MDGKFSWADQTTVHPIGLAAVLILAFAQLVLPRRHALAPLILMACFMSPRQRIVIASLDFTYIRILVLAGWIRVLLRGERRALDSNPLDRAIPLLVLTTAVAGVLRTPAMSVVVLQLGITFDVIGMYFLFRMLIQSWRDLWRGIDLFAFAAVPVLFAFVIENRTQRNLFSAFGGVPEITLIREGKLRCQGPFPHPIVAGCFWVSLMPLFVASWWRRGMGRATAIVGTTCAFFIALLTSSSTPLGGVGAALVGAGFYPLRKRMRAVRRGLLVLLLMLQAVMKKPVWHLIGRIDLVGGSTGWHRYTLIDQAIRRASEWWLIGTKSTAHWGVSTSDVANQYVAAAVNGGILAFVLFIFILVSAYRYVGRIRFAHRASLPGSVAAWGLGVSLLCHCSMFFGLAYFGQIILVWYMHLAAIASLSALRVRSRAKPIPKYDETEEPQGLPGLAVALRGRGFVDRG